MIYERLTHLKEDIGRICARIGKDPSEITLVGATKYAAVDQISEAVRAGLTHIGESKVQDAARKFAQMKDGLKHVIRHMIGHLQTNKVKLALPLFDLIQSVDSIKLIREIEQRAASLGRSVNILIEVNLSGEKQKFGLGPESVFDLLNEVSRCPHVFLQGLMTIAPVTDDKKAVRDCFGGLRALSAEVNKRFTGTERIEMKYLSMGMTNDYETALEEGSNMLRIGSAIFGDKCKR